MIRNLLKPAGGALVLVAGCTLLRPPPLAQTCGGWSQLNAEDQQQTAAALIDPSLMVRVRERQHLRPETPDAQVHLAVVGSITKTCDLLRQPGLSLAQVVSDLYQSS